MEKNEEQFSKLDTKIIKGLAIVLMLMHHLWAFPKRIGYVKFASLFQFLGRSSLSIFANFGNICISLFFFVGGYGIYVKSKRDDFNILNNIKKLYIKYWKVFLVFIPIGFIFFSHQIKYCNETYIYQVFANFRWNDVLNNFLGFASSYNYEWWFFGEYIIAIITFPFIKKLFENKSTVTNLFIIFIMMILTYNIFPVIGEYGKFKLNENILYRTIFCQKMPYVSCFWLGILFAKDNLLIKLRKKINDVVKFNILIDILGIAIIIYLRQFVIGNILDILYVPFLIVFFLDFIKYFYGLGKTFKILGNHSANMWLIHTFYCYYFGFFVKIVTFFKSPILCLLVLILLSLGSSVVVDFLWELILKGGNTIKKMFSEWLKRREMDTDEA